MVTKKRKMKEPERLKALLLERLKALLDNGTLTQAEFDAEKANLLDRV